MAGEIQLGGTSFASEAGGTITVNNGTLGSSVVFPSNHVLQVVSENFTDTASRAATTYVDTFLTKSITSLAANSKFLVMVTSITGGVDATARIQLRRTISATTYDIENATGQDGVTMSSDARLSGVQHGINLHLSYVDSPAASASTSINYLIRLRGADSNTVYLGQSGFTTAVDSDIKVLSSMIIMELAA
tara:strand:- start:236 stop:805 length:570 start_codon:yes stop_codon:yes gene_type:complete